MCEDYDGSEPIVDAWRRARKEHKCFACGESIHQGDVYHFTAQKDDEFCTFKHCARCWALGQAIIDAGADSWQYDLRCGVSWQEAFGEEPPDEVARLAFMTREEAQATIAVERKPSPWS